MVDVAGCGIDNQSQGTRGGSDSSLEKNNVYGIEPKVYTGAAASPRLPGIAARSGLSVSRRERRHDAGFGRACDRLRRDGPWASGV